MIDFMDKTKLIFLDTETTGLETDDRLCQVAYKFKGQEREDLFRPALPISVESMSISHITNQMVADKEAFINSGMFIELKNIFEKDNILVAHNADFDVEMLKKEGLIVNKTIDTFKIANYLDTVGEIPKYNLQYLRYYFDFDIPNAVAHNALGDIRVLEVIFDYYFKRMLEEKNDEESVLREMMEISSQPILIKKFNFGKYNGEKVAEIVRKDNGYLRWLLGEKNKDKENGKNEDKNWIYTLRYHLNKQTNLF
jgi:DNA polymerase III epsilon subunit-like protein